MHLLFTNDAAPPSVAPSSSDSCFTAQFFEPLLKKALKILTAQPISKKIPEIEVELVLIDDPAMQTINKQTRGLDKPTDVLSFADREVEDLDNLFEKSLGQIFISIPAAQRNADEMHQSLEEELRFLFIHGFLHILGYDHQTPKDETDMMTVAYHILGRPPYKAVM